MQSEQSICKVAIVGAGNMAREHIRAFIDVPGVVISGIHSRTRTGAESLASEFGVGGVYDSIAELYEKTRADLVVVTVFEMAMNPVSKMCFEYPWTVLLEKPAGYNVPDAQEIYRNATAKKRKALVAFNRRFYSSTRVVRADLKERIGPRFIKVQDQEDQKQALAGGQPEIVVRNWMYANSIHMIDFLRTFGRGRITSVRSVVAWNEKNPKTVVIKIEFDSGDMGLYEGVWRGPGPWAVSVNTAERRWEMRPVETAAFQNYGERRLQPVEPHEWDLKFKPGLRLQAEHAVAAALGRPSESVTIEDSMETMLLIKDMFASERQL